MTLNERIAELGAGLRTSEQAAEMFRQQGQLVPLGLRRHISRLQYDLELLRSVEEWAEEQAGWDPGAGRSGRWTEAEHSLLLAVRGTA